MKILILGAGPCGLGAAYHLNKLGCSDWQVFERNSYVGGLSASFQDKIGFTWDVGGHVLFSHYPYFDHAVSEALGDSWYEHQRESWIRIMQCWVPYPFQNNVRYLPDSVLEECISGLRNLKGIPAETANFREWMNAVFGSGIVKYFMEPYNKKVWGVPLDSMGKDWIAERVSVVDLARIEKNIAEQCDDLSWGPNNTFKFPRQGGTGAIYGGIADKFKERIALDCEVCSVNLAKKQVAFTSGQIEQFDFLINTTPLDTFVSFCQSVPDIVASAAGKLVHNSGLIVGLGFEGENQDSKCWIYFPENNSPFYRVTNFHNYSPANVPESNTKKYFSLMCETTCSPHKPESADTIVEKTVQGLINSGMISEKQREQIISRYLIHIPYSYPVPYLGRDADLKEIQTFLLDNHIYSVGRFGAWRYEEGNMDHSFMQGVDAVDSILKRAQS